MAAAAAEVYHFRPYRRRVGYSQLLRVNRRELLLGVLQRQLYRRNLVREHSLSVGLSRSLA